MNDLRICDTHNDFLTELPLSEIPHYIQRCKKTGVKKICASYWSSRREENLIEDDLLKRSDVARSTDDWVMLHLEDLWWVKDEEKLKFLKMLKPFSCSLTWNDENLLAGGSKSNAGISDWGRRCLETFAEEKVVVDVAHLNRKSFWQVSEILSKNIYCSHTGFCGVKRHRRNLTDRQVDFVVGSGGFVGLFFYDKCIKMPTRDKNALRPFGVEDVIQNLKYFTKRWGYDNIGLGTDFFGIENPPLGLEDYDDFDALLCAMKNEGFSDKQIDKIFYQNFIDYLSRI